MRDAAAPDRLPRWRGVAAHGAFYDKAMAIGDLNARIAFLNRGQGWVVRKLRDMIPRVRDSALVLDLDRMLSSHVANIALAERAVAQP